MRDVPRCTLVDGEFVKLAGARHEPIQQDGGAPAGLVLTLDNAEASVQFASPRPTPPPSRGHERYQLVPNGSCPLLKSTRSSSQSFLKPTGYARRAPTTLGEACDGSDLQDAAGRELETEVSRRLLSESPCDFGRDSAHKITGTGTAIQALVSEQSHEFEAICRRPQEPESTRATGTENSESKLIAKAICSSSES